MHTLAVSHTYAGLVLAMACAFEMGAKGRGGKNNLQSSHPQIHLGIIRLAAMQTVEGSRVLESKHRRRVVRIHLIARVKK